MLDTQIPNKSDANSRYEWTWAPDDVVIYHIYKEGHVDYLQDLLLKANDDAEYEIVMRGRKN